MPNHRVTSFLAVFMAAFLLAMPVFAQNNETPDPSAAQKPFQLRALAIKTEQYPINLETVLRLVEDQNLIIAQTEKGADAAKWRYRQRQAALLPDIEGTYNQSRLEGAQQVFGDTVTVIRKTVQPQVAASWTVYPGGRNIYEMLAARRRKKSADSLVRETYQAQLARATEEYYKLLAAAYQKKVAEQTLEQTREQVQLNEALVDVGRGIPLDLSQARTQYAQQLNSVVQAEAAIVIAEQILLNRLNLDPTIHLVPDETDAKQRPLIADNIAVDTLIEQAIKANPAIQTGLQEIKALEDDYKVVRSDLIPSVTVRAYLNGTGSEWGALNKTEFGGVSANMNLLQDLGLQIPFQMQERKKLIEQKELVQQQLTRDVENRVMVALLNSENYKSAIEASQMAVTSAEESYELAQGRFRAGYGIYLDVLTAQSQLSTARTNLISAVLNYNQAQVQLLEALGGITPNTLTQKASSP